VWKGVYIEVSQNQNRRNNARYGGPSAGTRKKIGEKLSATVRESPVTDNQKEDKEKEREAGTGGNGQV